MEVNVIKLEDGKEYIIVDTIEIDNNKYLFLGTEDKKNLCVRKVVLDNEKEYLELLDSKEELDKVMVKFQEKYVKNGENNEE